MDRELTIILASIMMTAFAWVMCELINDAVRMYKEADRKEREKKNGRR